MQGQGAFAGQRATYVALSAVAILALALLTSIWHSDVSGTIALLGLLSVYMSSTELLLLFTVLAPASIIVDIIRMSGQHMAWRANWLLVLLSLLEMAAKAAGTVFGWSLHRSITSGEGGAYQPINLSGGHQGHQGLQPPGPPAYENPEPTTDPFTGYGRSDAHNGSGNAYQPFAPGAQHL